MLSKLKNFENSVETNILFIGKKGVCNYLINESISE